MIPEASLFRNGVGTTKGDKLMNRIFAISTASDRIPTGGDGSGEITLREAPPAVTSIDSESWGLDNVRIEVK
jgi:hypothetical protein